MGIERYNLCDYNGYGLLGDEDDIEATNLAYEEAQRFGMWLKHADDVELNLHLTEPMSVSMPESASDSDPDLEPEEPEPETREQRIRRTHGRLRRETPLIQPLRRLAWARATHSMLGGASLATDLIEAVAVAYADTLCSCYQRQPLREAIDVTWRSMPEQAGSEAVRNYVTSAGTPEMRHAFQGYYESSHEVQTEKHNSGAWTLNFVKTVVRHLESPQSWAAFVAGIDPTVSFELHMHHNLDSTSGEHTSNPHRNVIPRLFQRDRNA